MVQLIIGNKGKGKTKCLLDKVNAEVKTAMGSICYVDRSTQHMYELNNRIRLINISDYMIENTDQFLGFISGMVAQDDDLEQVYFDGFLDMACLQDKDITPAIRKIQKISDAFDVNFIVSASLDEHEVPEELKELIAVAL